MKKYFLWLIAVFLIGGFGGIVLERTLIPWLASRESFRSFSRLSLDRTTIIQPKEEIIIDRAQEVEKTVDAVEQGAVLVLRQNGTGETVASGSGLVLTTDGVIAVPSSLAREKGTLLVRQNGTTFPSTILRSDAKLGVSLLRVVDGMFSAPTFVDMNEVRLGSTVVRLRAILTQENMVDWEVSTGIITRRFADGTLATSLLSGENTLGAALFTASAKLIGFEGSNGVAWAPQIRSFFETR